MKSLAISLIINVLIILFLDKNTASPIKPYTQQEY
jgi:hypothetical protein